MRANTNDDVVRDHVVRSAHHGHAHAHPNAVYRAMIGFLLVQDGRTKATDLRGRASSSLVAPP